MIRLSAPFWFVLIAATCFAMFGVKYQVQALEDELARTARAAAAEEHEIKVLDAEWAYLTRPETLGEMNRRFLSLAPITTKQLRTTAADVPLRPVVPAPSETAPATAEASSPQAAQGIEAPSATSVETAADTPPVRPPVASASAQRPARAAEIAKPATMKVAMGSSAPRPPKSLDDLIAQIVGGRR